MPGTGGAPLALLALLLALAPGQSGAFSLPPTVLPARVHARGARPALATTALRAPISPLRSRRPAGLVLSASSAAPEAEVVAALKADLLGKIAEFKRVQARDGQESIDFGVSGGELDKDSRKPRNLAANFYTISDDVGRAGDAVFAAIDALVAARPAQNTTRFLGCGNEADAHKSPLDGPWKLLFTTAADATFSANSSRGAAQPMNIVDARRGRITNVIDFAKKPDGSRPALEQLRVTIKASAQGPNRVGLKFRSVRAGVTRLLGLPLFGKRLTLYLPLLPAVGITRLIFLLQGKPKPNPYFDVLFLDDQLRIHKTDADNMFVQARPDWKDAWDKMEA